MRNRRSGAAEFPRVGNILPIISAGVEANFLLELAIRISSRYPLPWPEHERFQMVAGLPRS